MQTTIRVSALSLLLLTLLGCAAPPAKKDPRDPWERFNRTTYKLNDKVRGRKEEYARLLDQGVWLDCREPGRCKYCYLERLCDTLEGVIATVDERRFVDMSRSRCFFTQEHEIFDYT